ncbi:MarR family winged helix-turn-helix transcriptional regulator [Alcanivorax sp. 1008]|uniref:MarR family winged helix-turn-helix transcriptional regulator n=1 Tax=Alcanivorax sp. 1008 TaxID=2816853 RepID=UPI001D515C86|nr:MarR family transcriptional regulator [Alcanivorax sp. 1008]MCC1497028.1 MarR family transcriptional regulator [Alcanivorax sp. 1008]
MARHDDVLIALRRIIRATDLYSRRLSRESGLTAPQLLILQAIGAQGEITMGDIAAEVSLSQATVTTILDRLESRGLVVRQRGSADKRRVYAHLTEAGQAVIADAPEPLQETFVKRFTALRDWEQSQIISAVERIASMMDADDIDASPVLDVGAIDRGQGLTEASPLLPEGQRSSRAARR